jgi:hypothetical protein
LAIWCALVALGSGCTSHPQQPAATQPATVVDLATTQPSYWLDQPAAASVTAADFQKLWSACDETARDFLFKPDRQDFRGGVLTTEPMVSAQWLEPWRADARTAYDRTESSIATIRRTIRFEFKRLIDDTYEVTPKVLVERQSLAEQRITSVVLYRSAFTRPVRDRDRQYGTRESDVGVILPARYWYPIGRDEEFEKALAQKVQKKLKAS